MKINVPNKVSFSEAKNIAKQQGFQTVITVSYLPDGSTSIVAF